MISNPQLRSAIQSYSEELQEKLDPRHTKHENVVHKGLILFRQQHVTGVKFSHKKMVGTVRDVNPVQVELFFDQDLPDRCDCPEEGICRHQIAVFFAVYSKLESVFTWVQEWKKHWNIDDLLTSLQRGSDLLKKVESLPSKGPAQWVERIRQGYPEESMQHYYQLDGWAQECYRRLFGLAPHEREWKPLYRLYAAFESIKIVSPHATDTRKQHELESFIEKMVEEASMALSSLTLTATPFAFDEYLYYLREQSRQLLTEETVFPDQFTEMYTMLWRRLFTKKQDRLDEWHLLQETEDNKRVSLAIIHLAILLNKDLEAIEKIRALPADIAPFLLRMLEWLPKERLTTLLPIFLGKVEDFLTTLDDENEKYYFSRELFQALDRGAAEKVDTQSLEKLYLSLMPYSRFRYRDLLFDRKEFKTWAALQVYLKNSIEYIDRSTIDIVAKEEPTALKPLYHNTIIELIEEKNRSSYKKAVRYLKRLRTLYRKEKNMPQWENYLNQLLEKYRRLRAFQEECRKGKLIHEEG